MSIAHELSCEVAEAMLARSGAKGQSDRTSDELSDIVLEVHMTLRRLTNEARRLRLDARLPAAGKALQSVGETASAGH